MSHRITVERAMTDREHDQLLATATDRFERRLSEEGTRLCLEIADVRLEIASVRGDMTAQFAAARIHSDARHHELLKWALAFWVAGTAAVAGIVSALT